MDFLPVIHNGRAVYAGFWKRFVAGFIDFLILMPIIFLLAWAEGLDRNLAVGITILSTSLYAVGNIVFNALWGGTPGKLALGVRITKPDGSPIGFSEAFKRSCVDLTFGVVICACQLWALMQIPSADYVSMTWTERSKTLMNLQPFWQGTINALQLLWALSELVVLLFNQRKRAIHDFIAGTVVINKEFAKTSTLQGAQVPA